MTTDKSKNFFRVSAEDFKKIPGSPIAYWVSSNIRELFNKNSITEITISDGQNKTGDNDKFLRFCWEVDKSLIGKYKKWIFYAKGGGFRRWAGNLECVIDWSDDARAHYRSDYVCRIIPEYLWYKTGITWGLITSGMPSFRFLPDIATFDVGGSSVFFKHSEDLLYTLAYLNTNLVFSLLKISNPTINYQVKNIRDLPYLKVDYESKVYSNAKTAITLSQQDWDSYETSWDFQTNPLIAEYNSDRWVKQTPIWSIYDSVRRKWAEDCEKMRQLEMSNNRIFIDAYGLQDELTSDVPWDEITLTCNPWYRYGKTLDKSSTSTILNTSAVTGEKSQLQVIDNVYSICECSSNGIATTEAYPALSANFPYNKELEDRLLSDTIKEFISYAVGCLMGRYSPEKSGLILANQSNGQEEDLIIYETTVTGSNIFSQDPSTVSFSAKDGQRQLMSSYTSFFPVIGDNKHLIIDRDGVLPILDEEWFFDDIVTQFKAFVALTFGEENLSANMDFIESVLGKDIRKYFVKDFYKEHIQRYKKRPIYWLFSSPKGSFNALIYLHRYTPDTVSIVLNEYLRELMTKISTRIKHLIEENNRTDISNADKTRNLKQIDKYTAQLAELEDYERDVIFPLAQQKIAIDLDDGVKVNYCKFGAALKKIPGLEAKEE